MAAKLQGFSHFSSSFSKSEKRGTDSAASSSFSYSNLLALPHSLSLSSRSICSIGFPQLKLYAKLGGGDEEVKGKGTKKTLRREEEPEEYWQSAGEREGENPMKTPLPYIIIFGMSTPFVILAIAFANGWIKVPIR